MDFHHDDGNGTVPDGGGKEWFYLQIIGLREYMDVNCI
jgi:hypothetical protein